MKHIRAISIDLDDTLWPINPVIKRAEKRLRRWLRHNCPRVVLDNDAEQFIAIRRKVLDDNPHRSYDYAFQRRAGLAMLLEPAGYDLSLVETAYQVFLRERNEVELFADVIPALQQLSQSHVLIALTNGNADLGHIGLAEYFDHTIRAAEVGVAKPEAAIFAAAAAAADIDPEYILHIGDAPLEDVTGAIQAGMTAVWMNRYGRNWPKEHPPPTAQIGELGEILALLA